MTQKDERIQQLAYQIWESEGRPAHQHDRHWEMATRLYQAEQDGGAKKTAARKPRATKTSTSKSGTTGKTRSGSEKAATEAAAAGSSVTEKVESAAKKVVAKAKQAVKPGAAGASKARQEANGEATGVGAAPATPKKPRAPRAKSPAAKPAASE